MTAQCAEAGRRVRKPRQARWRGCYGNGVRILKRGVEALEGQYDFLTLHRSFEHLPDSAAALRALAAHLALYRKAR